MIVVCLGTAVICYSDIIVNKNSKKDSNDCVTKPEESVFVVNKVKYFDLGNEVYLDQTNQENAVNNDWIPSEFPQFTFQVFQAFASWIDFMQYCNKKGMTLMSLSDLNAIKTDLSEASSMLWKRLQQKSIWLAGQEDYNGEK